ncbi:DUF2993 domain-containing protein [Streptomyces sp. NPDC005805]|uniref:LmeA family phospholipid-binding protein n=1 Tax=Streptomyces sp. NPDC005805 TaxID=3157068 RepID=UPI0033C62B36
MRALRILLIVAVVLGGLFVAADRLAVNYAESETADRIRTSQGLDRTPEVSIHGFPFLTQVLGKELDEVDVALADLTATAGGNEVNVTEARAELRGVRIDGSFSSATAARADGSARISYADLTEAAPGEAEVTYAGPERAAKGQVKVSGPLVKLLEDADVPLPEAAKALIGDREVATYSTVTLVEGATVRLKAESLPKLPLPGFEERLRKAVDLDLRIEGLPSTITLDKVEAGETGLRFSGTGEGVRLTG